MAISVFVSRESSWVYLIFPHLVRLIFHRWWSPWLSCPLHPHLWQLSADWKYLCVLLGPRIYLFFVTWWINSSWWSLAFIKCFHTYWKIYGKWWRHGAPLVDLTLSREYTRWVSNWMIRLRRFLLESRCRTLYMSNFGTSSFFVLKRRWFIWLWHVFWSNWKQCSIFDSIHSRVPTVHTPRFILNLSADLL